MRTCILVAAAALAVPAPASAQVPVAQGSEPHWGITLGQRVLAVRRALPVVDQVVLVPDAATYLDELSRWSPQARYRSRATGPRRGSRDGEGGAQAE